VLGQRGMDPASLARIARLRIAPDRVLEHGRGEEERLTDVPGLEQPEQLGAISIVRLASFLEARGSIARRRACSLDPLGEGFDGEQRRTQDEEARRLVLQRGRRGRLVLARGAYAHVPSSSLLQSEGLPILAVPPASCRCPRPLETRA